MEGGFNEEDNAPDEVIVLDDSCEGDVLNYDTSTDTRRNADIGTDTSAQPKAAPGIAKKGVVPQVTTMSSQMETVSSKGCVIHVPADMLALPVEDCPSKDTAACECLLVQDVSGVNSAGCQQHHSIDLTTMTRQPSLVEPIKAACISDDASSQFVETDSNIGDNDTHKDAGENDKHTLAPDKSSEDTSVNSKSITYISDDTLVNFGLVNESTSSDVQNDHLAISISSEVDVPVNSEVAFPASCKMFIPVSSELDIPVSYKVDTPVSSELDIPVSSELDIPVSYKTDTPVSSELDIPVSSKLDIPVSSELDIPASSEVVIPVNSKLDIPMSSEVDIPVSSELDIPISFELDIPVSSEVVIPASREEPRRHEIPSDVIDNQVKVACTDTASHKGAKDLFQDAPASRYIIIRNNKNTKIKQEVVRKPGEKLTSLLQRLTAGKRGDVAVTFSKNRPLSVSATEAQAEVHQSSLSGSPAESAVSMHCEEPAFSQQTVTETSPITSGKTTVTFSPVFHKAFPVLKLPSQTDSSMKTDHSQASLQSQTSETLHFEKIGTPVNIPAGVDPGHLIPQLWYVTQARTSHPISTPPLPTKTTKVFTKSGEQEFTVFGPVDDSKQPSNSSAAPGLPAASFPAGKIKYVLRGPHVQGPRTPNIVFAGPGGHSILLGKAGETYLQPLGVQNTTRKSKYQFSLLQSAAAKIPEAAQINVGIQSGTMKSSQTVRSLLSSFSKTAPTLKSTKHSISETGSVHASTSLSGVNSTIILQETTKPPTHPNTEHDQQTQIRQYQLTNTGQIIIQPVSQPFVAVTTSSNKRSPGVTSVTLSKLAAAISANSVPINKACAAPNSSPTTSGKSVIVMPQAVLSAPVPTVLPPSSVVSSTSAVSTGTATYNITPTCNQSDTLKAVFVPKTLETNTAIQSSTQTVQHFSDLISRIALQSASGTPANKPPTNVNSSMQALNIALLQQIRQGASHLGDVAAPVRIIVSQDSNSSLQSAAKSVVAQSEPSEFTHCGTITTKAGKYITLSKTAQRSPTVTGGSKQTPKLIYPKPVSTEVMLIASSKAKSVSLLPMSLIAKNQTTTESSAAVAHAESATKTHILPQHQPKDDHIVGDRDMKNKPTNSTPPNSYSKKVKVSANTTAPRKSKNAVYTAILRTGQGPVSVRVVAPDMDDDSSDTMSDTGLSNVTLSEESVLTIEDTRGKAKGIDNGPSNKLSDNHVCCEELSVSDQECQDRCVRDDAVLNTNLQEMDSSMEPVLSEQHVQDVDGEETDTDTEVTAMEEQDMSVLRQLLTNNTDTKSPFDAETVPHIDNFSACFDLLNSSNAGSQSVSAESDHEQMALLTSNTDNSSIDPVTTEQYSDVKSCDLKIESVFSLRDSGNFEDTELSGDDHDCQEVPDDQTRLLPVFNVQTSDDWKSFVSPCFVVLERLHQSEFTGVGANASKCSGYCRKRTLDYLCNLNLLRCINHPDPFMFVKSKPQRRYVKKIPKKITKHKVIAEISAHEEMSTGVYVQEAVSESFVDMKTSDLTKALTKLSSMVKEICVKKDGDKSPSEVKETYPKKTIDKTMLRVTPLKKPLTIFSLLTKKAYVKRPLGDLRMKPACVKERLRKLSLVVKEQEACGKGDMKPFQQADVHVLDAVSQPSPVIKETHVIKDVVKSVVLNSSLVTSLSENLPHPSPEKANISDSLHLSIAPPTGDQIEHTSAAEDDQKTNDKTSSDLDSSSSHPDSSKAYKALRELQAQVNRKRATNLIEKLCRKKGTAAQIKHTLTNYKINMAGQKLQKKVAVKKSRRKQLAKCLPVYTDKIISGKRKYAFKNASGNVAEKLLVHIKSLPDSDHISHESSKQNSAPQDKEAVCTDTPGVKCISDSRSTHLCNVQNENIKTKGHFVHLQPKVPDIPQDKIQAALHSLNNYLAATGRKPTTGNTQYILLKIDEQHVLVKWPITSASTSQQNSTSVPTFQQITTVPTSKHSRMLAPTSKHSRMLAPTSQQSSTSVPTSQQSCTTVPTSQQSSSTVAGIRITPVTSIAKTCRGNKQKQSKARSTTTAAISNNAGNSIQSLASTSTLGSSIFTVSNPTSNITTKPNSNTSLWASSVSNSALGKGKEFKIIRTHAAKGPHKLPPYKAQVPSARTQKNVTNVIMKNQATDLPYFTNSTFNKTSAGLNRRTVISLLKSGVLTQSHNQAVTTRVSSTSSPIIPSAISSPVVSHSSSKTGSSDAHSSKLTGSEDTNITLSRLPPNSTLLPARRRPHIVLSKEDGRAKRRRLEEKYPLPPGVVIKSEPDDYQEDCTSPSPGISSAFSANTTTVPTEHIDSPEPLIMSSDDQLWSVEDSVNIDPYLTDIGHAAEEHAGSSGVQGLSMNSAFDDSQSSHSYLEAENSSDEQDGPPALLDETIDDSDEDVEIENTDVQEDVPPVLQPMFTSSCSSLVKDTDVQELDSTELTSEMPADLTTFVQYNRHVVTARDFGPSADSISTTSLYSESSIDSGVDTNSPRTSFSHTSAHAPIVDRPVSKNLKIQYLKDLLKKKEMEIENMKRLQSELLPSDFDI